MGRSRRSHRPRPLSASLVLDERHDPADARLAADELPRKGADQAAAVQHLLDVTADILGVDDPVPERDAVHREPPVFGEVGRGAATGAPLVLTCRVRPVALDRGVHRMVGRARVHPQPRELPLDDPFGELAPAARVVAEVADLVLLGCGVVEPVPARVDDQDVAFLHLDLARDVLRRDHRPVLDLVADVRDHALAEEAIERDARDVLASGDRVHLPVDVRGDVQRRLEPLRHDPVGGMALEVGDLRGRVVDPSGRVHAERVCEIDRAEGRYRGGHASSRSKALKKSRIMLFAIACMNRCPTPERTPPV